MSSDHAFKNIYQFFSYFSFLTDEETLVLYSLGKFPKVPKTLNDRHKILNCLAGQKNTWEMEQ